MRSLFEEAGVKPQFAGHETFPLRYGWLKKAFDAAHGLSPDEAKARFSSDHAISEFGVGKNMVLAMRHWALATGMLELDDDRSGGIRVSPVGDLLNHCDPYLEHPGSLWLIHWSLASTPGRAATWYFAFNEFNEPIFTRDLLLGKLVQRLDELREAGKLGDRRVTDTTLKRDVDCLVRSYSVRTSAPGRATAEDGGLESPLAELALMQPIEAGGGLQMRRGAKATLPDEVFAYALVSFWREFYPTRREFSLEALTHEPGSPGRVFLLDEESTAERLLRLESVTKRALRWDESTGLRQVYAHDLSGVDQLDLIRKMYATADEEMAA